MSRVKKTIVPMAVDAPIFHSGLVFKLGFAGLETVIGSRAMDAITAKNAVTPSAVMEF